MLVVVAIDRAVERLVDEPRCSARLRRRPSQPRLRLQAEPERRACRRCASLNALMLQVAHGIPCRCSITLAAAATPGSATITSGRTSSSSASRSATWPGTAVMKTSRMSNLNFATPLSFARSGNSASISLTSRSGAWTCGWNVAPVASTLSRYSVAGVPVDRVPARGELEGERDQRPDVAGGGHGGEEEARHERSLATRAAPGIGGIPRSMEARGIEPLLQPCKGRVLPLPLRPRRLQSLRKGAPPPRG